MNHFKRLAKKIRPRVALAPLFAAIVFSDAHAAPIEGWLNWRGPFQNGTSLETGLPNNVSVEDALWTADFPGGSTPVIANGKLYIVGHVGTGPNLQEGVGCFDAATGEKLWQHTFNDFLSDIIYTRYATSAPTIDPETGNVYMQGTQGLLVGFTGDGELLWKVSMMEEFGRLTFPNGRTATPFIDKDLVITRGITANWGSEGPGGDRFYAFDKRTGDLVWSSTPADRPHDSCFSHPYFGWLDGKRVFYATCGDGSVVCANARTGQPIWRVPLTDAGINATVLVHNNETVIAIYGTPYRPGQMVAFRIPDVKGADASKGPLVVERSEVELWSRDISTSTSSPILVGDRIYVVAEKGDLYAVDVNTGETHWSLKIGIEQRNSCPLYADGKLYVPMLEAYTPLLENPDHAKEAGTSGSFFVIAPGDREAKVLSHIALEGRCFGTPAPYNGRVYVQTTEKLYCFGKVQPDQNDSVSDLTDQWPEPGPPAQLQIIPAEVLLQPEEKASFRARKLDAEGFVTGQVEDESALQWEGYIPPTARVRASMNAKFNENGQLVAAPSREASAGAFKASLDGLNGFIRGRILPGAPFEEDFEEFELNETSASDGKPFAYPPLPWIGARIKFEVREADGSKALVKTVDNKFFQRATVFIGDSEMKNYTIQADVMSDGNRRKMSNVGLVNQRYYIVLKGNEQKLEVSSNSERLRVPAAQDQPNFRWKANVWYRLKTRVDVADDGSGVVRAKAWPRDEAEPADWTLEVPHETAHQNGSPGLFGFSPQEMPVYIDNIVITRN